MFRDFPLGAGEGGAGGCHKILLKKKKIRSGSEGMIYSAWLPLAMRSSISAPFSRISAGLLQERRDPRSPVQNPLEANISSSKH